ncbi:MAG TPA: hypothetical protein VHU23_14265 [Rhizomicrobium sp.]|nr:hypothetical protein [Rhizomicrobium sp.]
MHERIYIFTGYRRDRKPAKQRFDMAINAPSVRSQRAGFLRRLATRKQTPRFGIGDIQVAQFADGCSFTPVPFFRRRISTIDNLA